MTKSHFRKLIAIITATIMIIASVPTSTSAKTSGDNVAEYIELTPKRDLFTKHFLNPDGTVTAVMYGEQIHIPDGDSFADIDNSLVYDENSGRYENRNNPSFGVSFAERANGSTPTVLFDKISWQIKADGRYPDSGALRTVEEKYETDDDGYPVPEKVTQTVVYDKPFGQGTELRYTVSQNKVEEDIIFSAVPDISALSFVYGTDGLTAEINEDFSVTFVDKDGEPGIVIGAPYVYDAAGEVCGNTAVALDSADENEPVITYVLDTEWLRAPDRVYPVTFDPTITNSDYTNTLYDTYTKTGDTSNKSSSGSLYVGHWSGKTYHTFMRFSNLPNIGTYSVAVYATLKLTFAANTTTAEEIGIYPVNASWNQSTITYLNEPAVGSLISTGTIVKSGNIYKTATYPILPEIKYYLHGVNTGHFGFMLRYTDETTTNDYNVFGSIQNGTSSRRPVLSVVYEDHDYDEYYSHPTSSMFLYTNTTSEERLQKRANCYGYAFRMFCDDSSAGTYKQQPGEFADKSGGLNIYNNGVFERTIHNYQELQSLLSEYLSSAHTKDERMDIIEQLITADAATLGYTVTEYTGSTIPDATLGERLIAVVTSDETFSSVIDYHFYMQHSDNSWTHKQGSYAPSDKSISLGVTLTNSNIRERANEGAYANGAIKFFYITRNAIVDHSHANGHIIVNNYSLPNTVENSYDKSGDHFWNSKDHGMISGTYVILSGRLDYPYDGDCLAFTAPASDTYSFYVTSNLPAIDTYIYDENMDAALTYTTTDKAPYMLTAWLQAGRRYYLKFSCPEYTTFGYNTISNSYSIHISH